MLRQLGLTAPTFVFKIGTANHDFGEGISPTCNGYHTGKAEEHGGGGAIAAT